MDRCKQCKKKLRKHKGRGHQKMFCNDNCKTLWRYHNIPRVNAYYKARSKIQTKRDQQDPVKSKKLKAYFKMWRQKNREHFNELCRNSQRRILQIRPENYRI